MSTPLNSLVTIRTTSINKPEIHIIHTQFTYVSHSFPSSNSGFSLNSTSQLLSVMEKALFVLHDVNLKIRVSYKQIQALMAVQ